MLSSYKKQNKPKQNKHHQHNKTLNIKHWDSYWLWFFQECYRGSTMKAKVGLSIWLRSCILISALSQAQSQLQNRRDGQQSRSAEAGDKTAQQNISCLNHHPKHSATSALLLPQRNSLRSFSDFPGGGGTTSEEKESSDPSQDNISVSHSCNLEWNESVAQHKHRKIAEASACKYKSQCKWVESGKTSFSDSK